MLHAGDSNDSQLINDTVCNSTSIPSYQATADGRYVPSRSFDVSRLIDLATGAVRPVPFAVRVLRRPRRDHPDSHTQAADRATSERVRSGDFACGPLQLGAAPPADSRVAHLRHEYRTSDPSTRPPDSPRSPLLRPSRTPTTAGESPPQHYFDRRSILYRWSGREPQLCVEASTAPDNVSILEGACSLLTATGRTPCRSAPAAACPPRPSRYWGRRSAPPADRRPSPSSPTNAAAGLGWSARIVPPRVAHQRRLHRVVILGSRTQ